MMVSTAGLGPRILAVVLGLACAVPARALAALPRDQPKPKSTIYPGEPGSGMKVEQRLRPPDLQRLQAPSPRRPNDAKELEAMAELERLLGRYKSAHEATADTVTQLLVIENVKGKTAIDKYYEKKVKDRQENVRKLRAQAVKRYQDFLKQHPNDATWTPEISFRLAELHLETANERLARDEEAFDRQLTAYQAALEKNPNAEPPQAPMPDYRDAIALYRDVVQRFPRFHLGDGALYMMGTLLFEMEQLDESRQSYLALACSNRYEPPTADGGNLYGPGFQPGDYASCTPWKDGSAYAPEAWLRIGEVHYDLDEFEPALEAYQQVAKDPGAELYDEALIRMAWTLYLMRRFPDAAKRFDEFVRYADAHKKDPERTGALGLRDDALRYLAKTYAEDDWDLDDQRDRVWGVSRLDRDYHDRGKERHVPEIYAALGDLLAEQTQYDKAIQIWQTTLKRWPLAPAAPSIQARVLSAHELLQDKPSAAKARDLLATNYLRGTKWFYANEDDPEAIEGALKLAEEALVATALDHHAKAQALRSEGDLEGAKVEYTIAARAYEAYLERFPDTPSSYEYRYNFADALYYGGQFLAAAEQYGLVRDSPLDDRLQEDAANGAVLAYEGHVEAETQAGRLAVPDMPKEGMEGPFDKPKAVPELLAALKDAYDRFVQVRPDSDQAGTMMYLAGTIAQKYHHFDEAEARFAQVLADHCEENVAINAGMAIFDGKVVRQDLKGAQEWTRKLAESGCGEGEEAAKFAGQLKTLGNAVRFKEAQLLYDAGEFEAAADRFIALVDQAPDDPNADRAIYNAAVAYETIGRFGSASQTYKRIYTRYPDSEFADDALLRTGFNHARFFEFEEAVSSYLVLAEDNRYKDSEHRETGLWNAADLLDNLQEYPRAAKMYELFAAKTEDADKAAEATFRAAKVLGKTEDHRATILAYQAFLDRYGNDLRYADKTVEAQLRIGQAHAALGSRTTAEQYYTATIAMFQAKGMKPASDAADFPSEAQFLLAEYVLKDVLATKITSTNTKKLEKESQELTTRMVAATAAYEKVVPYLRLDWSIAAMYRIGNAFETYAINLRAAPVPKELKEYTEPWFAYKDLIDGAASRFEQAAIKAYENTIAFAKQKSFVNEWVHQARERLNIYKPEEYPLLRQPALDLQIEDLR